MARVGKLNHTIVLIVATCLLFGVWWKLSSFRDCLAKNDGRRRSGNVHLAMDKMFPTELVAPKVDLSLGILCQPDEWYVNDVIRSIRSVTQQIEGSSQIKTYIVFVGILSTKPDEVDRVKNQFRQSSSLKNVKVTFVTADTERLKQRLDSEDVVPAFHADAKELVELRSHLNLILSILYWHASQCSRYYLLTDARYALNNGALSKLVKEYEDKGGSSKLFRIKDQKVDAFFGALYGGGRILAALAEYMYWMSPYQESSTLMLYYDHLMQSHGNINFEKSMFSLHKINVPGLLVEKNPVAMITTNMTVVDQYFASNPYENGEMFWSSTATKGSFIIFKFVHLVKIKRIRIETGKNIYFIDMLTEAVLEEAEEFNGDNNCGTFNRITDFRSSRIDMNVSARNVKTACLRIRLIADQGHWIAIRFIQVFTF